MRRVMNKKQNKEYTTIQVRKDINQHIKNFCKDRGWTVASVTENFWLGLISSSMSGSISI